jgi:glucosamine-6-phosphate deaminase
MDVSILQHSVEDFRSHANRERIPTQIYLDSSQACQVIGDEIIYQINQREKNQAFVLGLATGSTPIKVYQHLIRAYQAGEVSFSNVHSFNLDEYFPMDPQSIHSYVEFMHKNLFDHIDIPKENIHIPDGTIAPEEIDDYCKSYEETIESLGGIDIQLLGIGRTGHIGFNEPGSAIHSKTRRVWLDPITRKDAASSFFGEQFVPQQAITMGADTIMKAKKVYLMAWGEGKSNIICRTVEGTISDQVPATFLQQHNDCVFILDNASASELTRQKTPWLVGSCKWDSEQIKKAVIWLARHCEKSILKLSREDYENNHLQSLLVAINYEVYQLNYKIHQSLLEAFDVWNSNKNLNQNTPSTALVFSPHPDDDVISMGGTLIQLADNGFDVHVAYQTSGNIAVYDDEVIRFMQFCLEMNPDKHSMEKEYQNIVSTLANKKIGDIDSLRIQELKGLIRKGEALAACRVCSVPENNAHFMNLPFYETGAVKKKPHQKEDVDLTIELLRKVKPEKIFAAGDLSDPHGTHRVCLQVIFDAIDALLKAGDAWVKNCEVWLYRGAWQEWGIDEIQMAVPLSPKNVLRKRQAIFKHQSQKDSAMFPGPDAREFWQRAEQRNIHTANQYNLLGLPEFEAVEGFVRYMHLV